MRPQTLQQSNRRDAATTSPAKHRPAAAVRRLLAVAALVALIGVLPTAAGMWPTASPEQVELESHKDGVGPIATWLDDLIDDLEDTADDLDDAESAVGEQEGPLVEPDLSRVAGKLDTAAAIIDRILDSSKYPSLDPPDAGTIDYSSDPDTLPGYAYECAVLAEEARDEAKYGAADEEYIGTRLQTLRNLITRATPHNYRTKAGIE